MKTNRYLLKLIYFNYKIVPESPAFSAGGWSIIFQMNIFPSLFENIFKKETTED